MTRFLLVTGELPTFDTKPVLDNTSVFLDDMTQCRGDGDAMTSLWSRHLSVDEIVRKIATSNGYRGDTILVYTINKGDSREVRAYTSAFFMKAHSECHDRSKFRHKKIVTEEQTTLFPDIDWNTVTDVTEVDVF